MKKNEGNQRKKRQKHGRKVRGSALPMPSIKMKVKKGDMVKVVSGKDKGKTGEVLAVFPKMNRVVVDNVGMIKRHLRKSGKNQSGRIVERPSAIHASNVMRLNAEKKPTRAHRDVKTAK